MFAVGDRVRYVGRSCSPYYQSLGVGVVVKNHGDKYYSPVHVLFDGYDYASEPDYLVHVHPCDFDELEKCDG